MLWPTDFLSIESWILIISAVLLFSYRLHKKWNVLKQWNIPHDPPSVRTLGGFMKLYSDKHVFELECKKRFGPIWGYYLVTEPRIVVHDLEKIRQICIREFSSFPNRLEHKIQLTGKEAGGGLISARDGQWKRIRTTLAPAFSPAKLKEMAEIVNQCVDNTLKRLTHVIQHQNGIFIAKHVFDRLSLDVICATAFGTDVNSQDLKNKEPEIVKQAKSYVKIAFMSTLTVIAYMVPPLRPLLAWLGGQRKSVVYFRELCKNLMEERTKESMMRSRIDLVHIMLDSKISDSDLKTGLRKGLTSNEIIGNAMTMLVAGYATTSGAMNFFSYNLAVHPDIQKKLQAELDKLFAREENPNYDMINDLKFLDMCINESLRLYCPVARTIRTAKTDITIGGLTIPKGRTVNIPIFALSRDPEYWDEPNKFKPERMRDMSDMDLMPFLPFGVGPRNCIGSRFAMMEIKLTFVKILKHFSFEPTNETPEPPLRVLLIAATNPKINFELSVVPRSLMNL